MPKIKVESAIPVCPRCGKRRLLFFKYRSMNRCWYCNERVKVFKARIVKVIKDTIGDPSWWVKDDLCVAYNGFPIWFKLEEMENMDATIDIVIRRRYHERTNLFED